MYEEMPENKKRIVKLVTEQVIAMLANNVLNEYGTEGFMGWLEDGDVFANSDERLTKEEIEEATDFAKKIAPTIDELTYNYLNLGY